MSHVVITNPQLAEERDVDQVRVVVHIDALPEHLGKGWELVGPCSDRSRDPLLADDEQFLVDQDRIAFERAIAAEAARVAAEIEAASQTPDGEQLVEANPANPDGENADGTIQDQE